MDATLKATITKLLWDAYAFYLDKGNDFVLRVYIANELRALEQLEGSSPQQIEEMTDMIEATIIETPDEIKQIKEPKEEREAFEKHIHTTINNIVNGNVYGISGNVEDGATVNQTLNFGDTHNHPK